MVLVLAIVGLPFFVTKFKSYKVEQLDCTRNQMKL